MSAPLTLAPVPASSPSSTATPVSPTASPSDSAGMNSPTTSNSNTSTTNNPDNSSIAPSKRKASRRANTAERRATHNAVERQRRETLNGRFLDLAALLPNLATVRRPSKSAIVNSSIALIHSHRRARAAAGRELRTLEEETQALRREVNEWRSRTALPALQAPQRSAEFMALLHAGDADDEGAAAEEERRAYLLAGQGGMDDDEEEWDAAPQALPQPQHTQQHQQHQPTPPQHSHSVGPAHVQYVPMMSASAGQMIDDKMAQWNALQYAMSMQGMHHGHGQNMDPRVTMAMQAQRDHPQWSAAAPPPSSPNTGAPALFARPVPIPQHAHSQSFSGPFAFGVPPLTTNNNNTTNANNNTTFNTSGYLSTSPANSHFVGSPTGSTPPATTSSSFEDAGTESEGEISMHGHGQHHGHMGGHMGVHGQQQQKWMPQQRVGGPGGFAAMGMGVVI
ncbi:hypothetical protein M422DRAFT_48671 [Sphaerobolus stellatus SS14]|uniref:BHLH domain-containing protein n=1 Tax=Sphaerobolus stellatus (strain SS14) TaxID=990650 RepID=A0A0C9VSX5_SPHS4|nr:hypothetical protein M422DRAFT_48671 [Sphaerobolus stellatus SS14]